MTETKQNNIIFMEGKERILEKLFSDTEFGYLAVGYNSSSDTNGFINVDPEDETSVNGFYEISDDSTYSRAPLSFHSIINRSSDNKKVTAKFTAELGIDNIINNIPINQIAIVDSSEKMDPSTTFFAAAVTEEFVKNEKLALVYTIEITI